MPLFGSIVVQSRSFVSARYLHPKRFTSILENVPNRPRSAWQIYLRDNLSNYKNNDGKVDIRVATKELGAAWKTLGESEKSAYQQKFEHENKVHLDTLHNALNNATAKQFQEENNLRKKYNMALLKDPKRPKRPKNNFLFFLEDLRSKKDPITSNKNPRELVSEAALKFKSLSESEAKIYNDKAAAAVEEYRAAMEKYAKSINE